jgi:hypothetical protein
MPTKKAAAEDKLKPAAREEERNYTASKSAARTVQERTQQAAK